MEPYAGSVALLDHLESLGTKVAVVSSSRNAPAVLDAAGLADRFEVVVDGQVAAEAGLPGKPAPDTFLEAANRLGVDPERAVVFEDAVSGVAAGHAGGFGLVVGVDRGRGRRRAHRRGRGPGRAPTSRSWWSREGLPRGHPAAPRRPASTGSASRCGTGA